MTSRTLLKNHIINESSSVPTLLTVPKIVSTFAAAAVVAVSLVSCSAPGGPACEATPSGSHSSSIKVSGEFGKEPKVTMPPAFEVTETERTVLVSGNGATVLGGEVVTADYGVYNAATGEQVNLTQESTWTEGKFEVNEAMENSLGGFYKTLKCAREGDRIVSAIPSGELFGSMGVDMSGVGIGATDTVVFIVDVSKVEPAPTEPATPEPDAAPKALPTPLAWVDNVPTVNLSADVPVVTLPKTDPPADLQLLVISEGAGALVSDPSSNVTVDYQGISWNTGEIFDQSYTRGEPATFPVGGVIDGFAAAMVGQKVGSTVLVTIPPAYGYGEGEINAQDLRGQTLVFLIQIHDVK